MISNPNKCQRRSQKRGDQYAIILLALSLSLNACGSDDNDTSTITPVENPSVTLILSQTLSMPVAVKGSDGQYHLVYELELRNATTGNATIEQIDVLDAETNSVIASLDAVHIADRLQIGGSGPRTTSLGAAQFAVLYMHLSFSDSAAVPYAMQHRITADLEAAPPQFGTVLSRISDVQLAPVPVLGPPLRGSGYIAADGCCDSTRHIRALLPVNGAQWLAQRYAIDWEQIDAQNQLLVGDVSDVNSYHIYGQDVLAVADGKIIFAIDGYPDQIPGALPSGIDIAEADGNHIILDLGNGLYALYAHLQPGSVAVQTGDTIKRGQVIGRVGNSGNTSEPHLHLHVMDAPSALVANGVPYVFDEFHITGIDLAGTADFDEAALTGRPLAITPIDPPTRHINELPMDLTVVDWLNE